jgi:hypothetical protein
MNLKPPSFDGEREQEDDVEAWLLGIKNSFQLQNYSLIHNAQKFIVSNAYGNDFIAYISMRYFQCNLNDLKQTSYEEVMAF